MALSCFCMKRTLQQYERTPMPEYDTNKKKIIALDNQLGKLIRDLEQTQNTWVRLGEQYVSFGTDAQAYAQEMEGEDVKKMAATLNTTAQEVGSKLKALHAGEAATPSGKLMALLKEFKKQVTECKSRSSRMESLAKDYDARRAVVDDKERANTPEEKMTNVRAAMSSAETKFREAEADVLQRQKNILEEAPKAAEATLVCFAATQADRVRLLQENVSALNRIRDDRLDSVTKALQSVKKTA
ncbi:hypothetical protein CDCA_CDCA14G3924 [Cyanidium caldarium]|uniref:Uncharacterized protein n=1 Tax=Cyanidium caldarium TaxID=2771 RepID=A0AAV9J062_CYACA|nr:hypothetical protein CDCA_CDCA14G3924 [Cyanidium caldarium]